MKKLYRIILFGFMPIMLPLDATRGVPTSQRGTLFLRMTYPAHAAALRGDVATITQYRAQELPKIDTLGNSVLHYAAINGNLNALLAAYSNVEDKNNLKSFKTEKVTILGVSEKNKEDSIDYFKKHLLTRNKSGRIPLCEAIIQKKYEVVNFLLAYDTKLAEKQLLSQTTDGDFPIMLAVRNQDAQMVALLLGLKEKASSQLFSWFDETFDGVRDNARVALWLPDKSAEGNLPIHTAAKLGNAAMVDVLLQADMGLLNALNLHAMTPLHVAAKYGKNLIFEHLTGFQYHIGGHSRLQMPYDTALTDWYPIDAHVKTPLDYAKQGKGQEYTEIRDKYQRRHDLFKEAFDEVWRARNAQKRAKVLFNDDMQLYGRCVNNQLTQDLMLARQPLDDQGNTIVHLVAQMGTSDAQEKVRYLSFYLLLMGVTPIEVYAGLRNQANKTPLELAYQAKNKAFLEAFGSDLFLEDDYKKYLDPAYQTLKRSYDVVMKIIKQSNRFLYGLGIDFPKLPTVEDLIKPFAITGDQLSETVRHELAMFALCINQLLTNMGTNLSIISGLDYTAFFPEKMTDLSLIVIKGKSLVWANNPSMQEMSALQTINKYFYSNWLGFGSNDRGIAASSLRMKQHIQNRQVKDKKYNSSFYREISISLYPEYIKKAFDREIFIYKQNPAIIQKITTRAPLAFTSLKEKIKKFLSYKDENQLEKEFAEKISSGIAKEKTIDIGPLGVLLKYVSQEEWDSLAEWNDVFFAPKFSFDPNVPLVPEIPKVLNWIMAKKEPNQLPVLIKGSDPVRAPDPEKVEGALPSAAVPPTDAEGVVPPVGASDPEKEKAEETPDSDDE